jgi:hypothetical protein
LQLPTGPIYGGYDFTKIWGQEGQWLFSGYSMSRLLEFLQWTSGLQPALVASQQGGVWVLSPSPVISFRAVLAACDDESYGLPLTLGG